IVLNLLTTKRKTFSGFLINNQPSRRAQMKKTLILTSAITILTAPAIASIPSSAYMREQVASQIATAVSSKVDTSASANQTMAGTYTVTGTMYATTPTLPTAE
ncbi:MAG: hypothetical protein IJN91_03675, partial [Alphaproteobacteria bacterium]|nr:hypothetical protein [Alphaproteobacteria bacterium]